MKKRKEKGGKEEKRKIVIKHTLKYLYEAEIPQKKIHKKHGRILEGGGRIFLAGRIYTPVIITRQNNNIIFIKMASWIIANLKRSKR